jgi:hypothetical protein
MQMNTRSKRGRGQSTAEFAMMMPFIMGITFFILEFQIFAVGMHHSAWAAYAAARAHVVEHNGRINLQNQVVNRILTGRIYTESPSRPRVSTHRRGYNGLQTSWGQSPDGVIVEVRGFGSLPYGRQLLNLNTSIPTHLGPDEWDRRIPGNDNDNERRWDVTSSGGRKTFTDNNRDDF